MRGNITLENIFRDDSEILGPNWTQCGEVSQNDIFRDTLSKLSSETFDISRWKSYSEQESCVFSTNINENIFPNVKLFLLVASLF